MLQSGGMSITTSSQAPLRLAISCFKLAPAFLGAREPQVLAGYFYLQSLIPSMQGRVWQMSDFNPVIAAKDLGWSHDYLMRTAFDLFTASECPSVRLEENISVLLRSKQGATLELFYGPNSRENFSALLGELPENSNIRQQLEFAYHAEVSAADQEDRTALQEYLKQRKAPAPQ